MRVVENVADEPVTHGFSVFIFLFIHDGIIYFLTDKFFDVRQNFSQFYPVDSLPDQKQIHIQMRLHRKNATKNYKLEIVEALELFPNLVFEILPVFRRQILQFSQHVEMGIDPEVSFAPLRGHENRVGARQFPQGFAQTAARAFGHDLQLLNVKTAMGIIKKYVEQLSFEFRIQ